MFDRKELKERAKLVLLRSYSKVFLACLAVNLISGGGLGFSAKRFKEANFAIMPIEKVIAVFAIIMTLMVIAALLVIFVISPLTVGLKKFMIENAKEDASLELLLDPFNDNYKNVVLVQFMKNLFIFLWSLPATIPTLCLLFFGEKTIVFFEGVRRGAVFETTIASVVVLIWVLTTLAFLLPSIIKELQYVMVPYILADNPETDWRIALYESKEMMVGNKWAFVKLLLSFLLWYIVANLLCCIGGFLVMPYVEATVCELYLKLAEKMPINTTNNIEYEQNWDD